MPTLAKKKIVLTIETDHYDTHKAMDTAARLAESIRESTGPGTVKVSGVQVR